MPLQKNDNAGRAYLRMDQARGGQVVELDDGFTCRGKGRAMLYAAEGGLYFCCDHGSHFISGQADDGIHCVGIYPLSLKD